MGAGAMTDDLPAAPWESGALPAAPWGSAPAAPTMQSSAQQWARDITAPLPPRPQGYQATLDSYYEAGANRVKEHGRRL
jgi:hypothetical protein